MLTQRQEFVIAAQGPPFVSQPAFSRMDSDNISPWLGRGCQIFPNLLSLQDPSCPMLPLVWLLGNSLEQGTRFLI